MKTLLRNKIHNNSKSHDITVVQIGDKKVKFTYECYNAIERYTSEVFDGTQWNHIMSMLDLGEVPNSSNYVRDDATREKRSDELYKKALKFVETLMK